jgi:hypothetical protein
LTNEARQDASERGKRGKTWRRCASRRERRRLMRQDVATRQDASEDQTKEQTIEVDKNKEGFTNEAMQDASERGKRGKTWRRRASRRERRRLGKTWQRRASNLTRRSLIFSAVYGPNTQVLPKFANEPRRGKDARAKRLRDTKPTNKLSKSTRTKRV